MQTTRMVDNIRIVVIAVVVLTLCTLNACSAKDDEKLLLESVDKHGHYLVKATFSFLYPMSYPPKTENEQKALCKSQNDAFKYLKEKTKDTPSILRRGIMSFVSSRQRHHRKYCTNTSSEPAQKFLAASKCLMKKFAAFREADAFMAQTLVEIAKRNYNDSTVELKQICCTFYNLKLKQSANIGPECNEHREIIEEMIDEVISSDLKLVCEDDDKLAKLCPKLEPLNFKRIDNYSLAGGKSSAGLALYLIATLGEPNNVTALIS